MDKRRDDLTPKERGGRNTTVYRQIDYKHVQYVSSRAQQVLELKVEHLTSTGDESDVGLPGSSTRQWLLKDLAPSVPTAQMFMSLAVLENIWPLSSWEHGALTPPPGESRLRQDNTD
jgi:hypothetical protein